MSTPKRITDVVEVKDPPTSAPIVTACASCSLHSSVTVLCEGCRKETSPENTEEHENLP